MKGELIPAEELEEQEQRTALGRLQGQGRHGAKVGSVRVGAVKLGGPGTLPLTGGGQAFKQPLRPSSLGNQGPIQIFQDHENAHPGKSVAAGRGTVAAVSASSSTLPSRLDQKENELAASKWSQASKGPKQVNIPLDKIGQYAAKPAFTVHEDHGPPPASSVTPHKLAPGTSNVLAARKADRDDDLMHCPVALFEPPDPTKRPMYCKDKVYQGATEFSFEELRAVRWRAREKERQERDAIEAERLEVERRKAELERERTELADKERQLREQQEAVARQLEEYRQMMAAMAAQPKQTRSASDLEGGGQVDSYSCPLSSAESSLKSNMDDTNCLISANPNGTRSRSAVAATPSPHGNKVRYIFF
jgi:hypothetical protein